MDITKTFDKVAESAIFLALGTVSYLRELREHGDCYHEVMMAKALKRPTILMLDQRLLPSEHQEIRECLSGLEIIGTVLFDSDNMDDRVQDELREILESFNKMQKKDSV